MAERIELRSSTERMAVARRLREPLPRFEYAERVPVIFGASTRFVLAARGVGFDDYFADPRTHLRHQLLNLQWKLDWLPGDWLLRPSVDVAVDFQQGAQAGSFEVEVEWRNEVPPSVVAPLQTPDEVEALELPPVRAGMFGRSIEWYQAMCQAAEGFEVTFNGERVPIQVSFGQPGAPFPKALALAQDRLFLWAATCPAVVHRLMDLCTASHIACDRHVRETFGRPMAGAGGGCDGGEMFSAGMFREFVSPYHLRHFAAFPGQRSLHMCGRIDHLLEILVDEWRLDHLTGFGHVTDKQRLAEVLGGKVQMHGGVDCWVLERGTPGQVRRAALEALEILAPPGGYMLCDGYNLAPGTPVENLEAMVAAAVEYGRPPQAAR